MHVRRGGVHWVHVHPLPGKKVSLRNVQKRRESSAEMNVHVPLTYDKIKTKKVGKKEDLGKGKASLTSFSSYFWTREIIE